MGHDPGRPDRSARRLASAPASSFQLTHQPTFGRSPVSSHSIRRNLQRFGGLLQAQSAKESQLHHTRFARIKFGQSLERLVERSDLPLRTVELVYLMAGIGLIGANGSGKSTFMKILGGELEQSSGEVMLQSGLRLGKLNQNQFAYEDERVLDVVMQGHVEMWHAMKERDLIYADAHASDADYMRAAELEAKFAEYGFNKSHSAAYALVAYQTAFLKAHYPVEFMAALLSGDAAGFETELQAFVTDVLSYHDATRVDPEAVYHGFVAGLLAALEPGYQVRSNRESGQVRPDVIIRPAQPGQPGVVLELKVARAPRTSLEQGIAQAIEGAAR